MAAKRRSTTSQRGLQTWFGVEFGFEEKTFPATRAMFSLSPDHTRLTSKVNLVFGPTSSCTPFQANLFCSDFVTLMDNNV